MDGRVGNLEIKGSLGVMESGSDSESSSWEMDPHQIIREILLKCYAGRHRDATANFMTSLLKGIERIQSSLNIYLNIKSGSEFGTDEFQHFLQFCHMDTFTVPAFQDGDLPACASLSYPSSANGISSCTSSSDDDETDGESGQAAAEDDDNVPSSLDDDDVDDKTDPSDLETLSLPPTPTGLWTRDSGFGNTEAATLLQQLFGDISSDSETEEQDRIPYPFMMEEHDGNPPPTPGRHMDSEDTGWLLQLEEFLPSMGTISTGNQLTNSDSSDFSDLEGPERPAYLDSGSTSSDEELDAEFTSDEEPDFIPSIRIHFVTRKRTSPTESIAGTFTSSSISSSDAESTFDEEPPFHPDAGFSSDEESSFIPSIQKHLSREWNAFSLLSRTPMESKAGTSTSSSSEDSESECSPAPPRRKAKAKGPPAYPASNRIPNMEPLRRATGIKRKRASSPGPANKKIRCPTCGIFITKRNLKRHMTTSHEDDKQRFSCTVEGCSSTFTRKSDIGPHIRDFHSDKKHRCPFCAKEFSYAQNLNRHKRTAHADKD